MPDHGRGEARPHRTGGWLTTVLDILSPTTIDTKSQAYIVVDGVFHAYLYVAGYGYSTTVGSCWLAPLVEAGEGVNLSFMNATSVKMTAALRNGVEMPLIGLGVMHMYGSECVRAICEAVEAGYRMIDTAAIYGNEQSVGWGIRECGADRGELFVTTKLWVQDASYERAKQACETSLTNLGLEYLDLYLIHQPLGDIYGAWRAMEELLDEGKVRAIGVSNLNIGRLVDLSMHNRVTPHVSQVEIHPFYQQDKVIREMKNLGVQPEGWSPFAEGRNDIFQNKMLSAIGKKYGKTPAQVILRWDIQRGVAVVPKSSQTRRIRENYDIWDFELTAEDMKQIAAMDQGKELFFEHDSPEMARMFGNYRIH